MKDHRDAVQAGGTTRYDAARPWNYTLQHLLKQQDWWYETFERWATLIAARVKTQGAILDGDAPVGSSSTRPAQLQDVTEGPATKKHKKNKQGNRGQQAPGGYGHLRSQDQHPMKVNGKYTTTRSGDDICLRYQNGACQGCKRAHVCNICLANHPASSCNNNRPKKGGKGGKR